MPIKESTYKKYCLVIDEWFVNGFKGTTAYLKIYPDSEYKSADSSFRELVEKPRVKEYIKEKAETVGKEHNIFLKRQIDALQIIIDDEETSNRDRISSIQEQNKLAGLYKEHNEQKKTTIKGISFTDE